MNCTIKSMPALRLIGFQKIVDSDTASQEIPAFWDDVWAKYGARVYDGNEPATAQEKAFADHEIGEFGICIDDIGECKSRYLIAGTYRDGAVPEGMVVYALPEHTWAVFDCRGQIPDALQHLEARIFSEWLPYNPDYALDGAAFVEWYDPNNDLENVSDYHTEVWIPVKKKG